jgi:hypothetical protein
VANGNLVLNSSGLMTVPGGGLIQGLTVGRGAGAVSTNTAVGANALASNVSGLRNTFVGYTAGRYTTGSYNVGVGQEALNANTSGSQNTAIGDVSLVSNTTGGNNTAVGWGVMLNNSTGASNTGLGTQALYLNTTASNNTAVGQQALYSNTTASNNTAVGYQSLYANTTGSSNTAVGQNSLKSVTTNSDNTAVGVNAARDVTGSANSAFGSAALIQTTTGSNNVAVGQTALFSNTASSNSTAVGYRAGYSQTGGGGANTLIGKDAGYSITSGTFNTFIGSTSSAGYGCGEYVTTGSKNTIIGGYSGNQGGLDIRTANNNIVLSDGDGNPRAYHNGYNWFSTSGGFISKLGSAYSNTYTTDSAWATNWATIIPGGVLGRGAVFLVYLQWNYTSGGSPYYLDANLLFSPQSTNGTGASNEIALLSSTHTGNYNVYYMARSVATTYAGGASSGLQIKMVDNTTPGILSVNVTIIGGS